jgi:type II secretory pathway pseudopilin PulG
MTRTKRLKKGFTLVEALAASGLLCMAVIALAAGGSRWLSQTSLNRQYETAAALIDKQFTMIDSVGIDNFILAGRTEGVFEGFGQGYSWKVVSTSRQVDYLYDVTITVTWVRRGRVYSLSADTMLNGQGLLAGLL